LADEPIAPIVRFFADGSDVIAVDERGRRFRTPAGSFAWQADDPVEPAQGDYRGGTDPVVRRRAPQRRSR
jgi:hypothetical protein